MLSSSPSAPAADDTKVNGNISVVCVFGNRLRISALDPVYSPILRKLIAVCTNRGAADWTTLTFQLTIPQIQDKIKWKNKL